MTTILDAGPLVSVGSTRGEQALRFREAIKRASRPLIIPAPVTAEVDYMLQKAAGAGAALRFIEDISAGLFEVECIEPAEYATILELSRRYGNLAPGLADLSIVVLAHRFRTHRILTIDQRHFRAMVALDGKPFTLLPWDER